MEIQVAMENCCMTMDKAISEFLFHCQYEKNLNEKTLRAYKIDLGQFALYIEDTLASTDIKHMTKETLKSYLQTLAHFKPKTIKRKIASLKAMLNFLEFEDDDYVNPFRKIKVRFKEPQILPAVMTIEEVKKILQLLYKERNENEQPLGYTFKAQTRNIAIVELLFATGIRVSELCNLKCVDMDIRHGVIKVFGKGSKERVIQICQKEVLVALRSYSSLFKPTSFFFINRLGMPLSTQSVRLLIKHYVKATGLNKKITPHTFRHTFATLLLEEDVDIKYIQNLLGHSSIATTQIYTHVNASKQKKILSTKHPRRKLSFSDIE